MNNKMRTAEECQFLLGKVQQKKCHEMRDRYHEEVSIPLR